MDQIVTEFLLSRSGVVPGRFSFLASETMPKTKTSVATKIAKAAKPKPIPWDGPESFTPEGGLSQSMIQKYLACRERFRIKTIEGWQALDTFRKAMEYGNMWHICEEHHAAGTCYEDEVKAYARSLMVQYQTQQAEIEKWYNICLIQFPLYVSYWKNHSDVKKRKPICQEKCFQIPYRLPSGRTVNMRGKFDSVDMISRKIWLQENKTKSEMNEKALERQLGFDLQSMYYLTALQHDKEIKGNIGGIRYNVIRRPLSGGKGSIRQHKGTKTKPPETLEHYYDRLRVILKTDADEVDEPCTYFGRWSIDVDPFDLSRYQRMFLNPILENICDDYEWWEHAKDSGIDSFDYMRRFEGFEHHMCRHYIHPFGTYNVLNEGGVTELDDYLSSGSTVGLERVETMFPEL